MSLSEELPPRARCFYVVKNGRVVTGELTPAVIVGVLASKGVLGSKDPEEMKEIAADVLRIHGITGWEGDE